MDLHKPGPDDGRPRGDRLSPATTGEEDTESARQGRSTDAETIEARRPEATRPQLTSP